MRSHLAQNERMADRLLYFVGDALRPPARINDGDAAAWLALVQETEAAAQRHRTALESYLKSRA
jgi:hypothetical protein